MKCYIITLSHRACAEGDRKWVNQRSNFNPFTPTNCPDSNPPYTLHWNSYGLEKLLFESTNNYLIDILFILTAGLFDTVRGNSVLATCGN